MASLKKNLGYQTVYQILNTIIPLVTAPYLARTLGAEAQGVFSYTQSVVSYFAMFGILGIMTYGTRAIAACGKDRDGRSDVFWNLYGFQLINASFYLLLYLIYIWQIAMDNKIIALCQMFFVLSELININWLFFGVENFSLTVKRSLIIRILSVLSIFVFVKASTDLWIYTLIMTLSIFFSNFILLFFIGYYVDFTFFRVISVRKMVEHIKPSLVLFIPLAAMSIYHTMDKTMLGYISDYSQLGYYFNADKIVNVSIGVISGIGTVFMPRISALLGEENEEEADNLFRKSLKLSVYIAAAICFGICAVADEFISFFLGNGFLESILLTKILSIVVLIKAFAFSVRYQYLIPRKMDKVYIKSVFLGAAVNMIFNMMFIPRYGALGAVFGTLVAEGVACIYQYAIVVNRISIKSDLLYCLAYIFMGYIMYFGVLVAPSISNDLVLTLFLKVTLGCLAYFTLTVVYIRISNDTDMINGVNSVLKKFCA